MYYFDNSATTQPLPEVMDTFHTVAMQYYGNPSSSHQLGQTSSQLLSNSRQQVAQLLGFDPSEIFFASSGTEVNNWIFKAIVQEIIKTKPNSTILLSNYEHPSIAEQLHWLKSHDIDVQLIPVKKDGQLDYHYISNMLERLPVSFISTMAVNNEVGALLDVNHLSNLLSEYPQVIWHMDAVQSITSQFELIRNKRIDMLTLSAHKFHGIRGVGILAARQRVPLVPLLDGGGQEFGVRSSTENLPAIVASAKALRIASEQQEAVKSRLSHYKKRIVERLIQNQWEIYAASHASEHIVCASYPPIPGEVLLHAFEFYNVYVSTTSACSSRKNTPHTTLRAMGVEPKVSGSAIRISMSSITSESDVEALLDSIDQVSKQFEAMR